MCVCMCGGRSVGIVRSRTKRHGVFFVCVCVCGPTLYSSGQSFWLLNQRSRIRFPAIPEFLNNSVSGTGFTQPREDK
jgi:hypothetical protein